MEEQEVMGTLYAKLKEQGGLKSMFSYICWHFSCARYQNSFQVQFREMTSPSRSRQEMIRNDCPFGLMCDSNSRSMLSAS